MGILFICYCVCSFYLSHLFYTVQQEICFVSIVLEMFLTAFDSGTERLFPLSQNAGRPSFSGGVTCLPLCKALTLLVRGGPRPFSVRFSLVLKAGCLNLSFTFTRDISGEVVITNSMYPIMVWEARGPRWD